MSGNKSDNYNRGVKDGKNGERNFLSSITDENYDEGVDRGQAIKDGINVIFDMLMMKITRMAWMREGE
jgi:hypothetical protein